LDRLLLSASKARIKHEYSKERLKNIVLQTVSAAGKGEGVFVRFWLTAGRGNFGISPQICDTSFYCVVHDYDTHKHQQVSVGVDEVFIHEADVPIKPPLLAGTKSVNYMVNAVRLPAQVCVCTALYSDTVLALRDRRCHP